MAQGILQTSNNECPEDVGNKYFMALLGKSFFQDPQHDRWGNVTACKMHDLMHDLAQSVAGTECIMQTFDKVECVDTLPLFVISERIMEADRKSKHSGTKELNGLKNLRGKLKIKNLKFEESSKLANLEGKQFLRSLTLDWGRSDDGKVQGIDEVGRSDVGKVQGTDEVVLEGLKPHPNFKEISVRSFVGVKFHLDDLEYISEEASNSSSSLSTTFFPSLEQITLYDCPKLRGWWRKLDYEDTELPSFPCLSKLDIQNCPNLILMPIYPSLEELKLLKTSSKPLEWTMTMTLMNKGEPSTSSCFSAPLPNLKSMLMIKISDLESLPMDGMKLLW
ncbi:putative disease resistance protein RGA3 [Pistacia vera]|uniref:putative disease resistance protein RGA3 n=1 Tax=Pistacia vera TaxID=55513 RepID=UPI0012632337|nr:putative disease resistance protein RGA3 [Pistacia vera]